MRVAYFASVAVLAAGASGCGGAGDPLGGPYGGSVNAVRPTAGNVSAVTDPSAAAGDDAAVGNDGGSSGSCANPLDPSCTLPNVAAPSGSGSSGPATGMQGTSSGATVDASSGAMVGNPRGSGAPSMAGDGGPSGGGAPGSSGGGASAAPTWSTIYTGYLAGGTIGDCYPCHGEMGSASQAYSWLSGRGYISRTNSALAASGSSCLSWFGGNMPPGGPRSNAKAVSDVKAWAAAGAKNN